MVITVLSPGELALTKITGTTGHAHTFLQHGNRDQHMTDSNLSCSLSKIHFLSAGHAIILSFWFEIPNIFVSLKIDSLSSVEYGKMLLNWTKIQGEIF